MLFVVIRTPHIQSVSYDVHLKDSKRGGKIDTTRKSASVCLIGILGDPGAVSGDGEKSKTGEEKFGRRKVKNEKKSSSLRS